MTAKREALCRAASIGRTGWKRCNQATDIIEASVPVDTGQCSSEIPAIGLIRRFLTFLAKMGLSVRDDPKKEVDIAGRSWGAPVDGLALSILHTPNERSDGLATVSVAIHNRGARACASAVNSKNQTHSFLPP